MFPTKVWVRSNDKVSLPFINICYTSKISCMRMTESVRFFMTPLGKQFDDSGQRLLTVCSLFSLSGCQNKVLVEDCQEQTGEDLLIQSSIGFEERNREIDKILGTMNRADSSYASPPLQSFISECKFGGKACTPGGERYQNYTYGTMHSGLRNYNMPCVWFNLRGR